MTDEEKAEDYEMDCIADVYRDDVCTIPYAYSAQKLEKAHLDGLAEGRKELEKENEGLKAEIENLKKTYRKQRNQRMDELQKENAELKKTIHNLVSAFNDYECAGPEQEQETTWEVLRDIMHEELFKMEKSKGSIKNKNV